MNTTSNARDEAILQEYFQNHYDRHLAEVRRRSTVGGRMEEALGKSDGSAADAFLRFFEEEISGAEAGKCLIYMPDFGINKQRNRKGKIIIEVDWRESASQLGEDCFEFQLASRTDLRGVRLHYLSYPQRYRYPTSERAGRYHNMFLSWEDALPLVQKVLFSSFFRQRLLMTTESRVLGSITTQRFVSAEMGQVLSFRSCVLNE